MKELLILLLILTGPAGARPARPAIREKVKPPLKLIVAERAAPVSRAQRTTGQLLVKLRPGHTASTRARIAKALGGKIVQVIPALNIMLIEPIPGAMQATGATKNPAIEYLESETLLDAQGVCVGEAPDARRQTPGGWEGMGAGRPFEHRGLPLPISQLASGVWRLAPLLALDLPGSRVLFRPDKEDAGITEVAPNDPYFRYQWGLGSYPYGIGLLAARQRATGQGVTVAVIDTGIRQDLTDLRGVRFVPGRNLITDTSNATDDNGHGSHVAGTIAQATNNGVGCAGIAPQAAIMPVKVLGRDGRGTNTNIAAGIIWAVDHGAQLLNMSLGGASSRVLQEAVRYAYQRNVTIIAAAGNGGNQGLIFPAGYSEVISVGAIDATGARASFSQWGSGLSISGPGVKILQQTISRQTQEPGYYYFSGTSMACPHVCGTAALLKQVEPGLRPGPLRTQLQSAAHDLGSPGLDSYYGAGAVDAAAALQKEPPRQEPLPNPPTDERPPPPPEPAIDAADLVPLVNQERAKEGVPAVRLESRLTAAAEAHARDMAENGRLSHTGSDGSNPGTRISRTSYPWRTYGETIAAGQQTPAAAFAAWLGSPPHKAILLSGKFLEIGVASYQKEASTTRYWCMVFAAR